jgi:hypothetical protein
MGHDAEQTMTEASDADLAAAAGAKPRTTTVLGLLALTSLTLSYLGAYAVSGALVEADVIGRWQPESDPRPAWLATGFSVLLVAFVVIGCGVRFLSQRQLRQIDEMSSEA